jgi:DNA-binding NarL/FixJ family response regulator
MRAARPDRVLLDNGLPRIRGGAAVQVVKMEIPSTRVLVVTGIPGDYVVFDALEAGADGFADKAGLTAEAFLEQIRATHEGRVPLSERARRLVVKRLQQVRKGVKRKGVS